jgi:nitroreductase
MTPLSPAEQRALVEEASRAPSVHNVQPARWRFAGDSVVLFRAIDRVLPVADPSGHDLGASLGAAFEGMSIALSRRGLVARDATDAAGFDAPGCAPVVRASIGQATDGKPDRLAPWVFERRAYRGRFEPTTPEDARALATLAREDVVLIPHERLTTLAARHDAATWAFESRPEYHRELWRWLRLSRRHPSYGRDGLNADCLALSGLERRAASLLLKPAVFGRLAAIGIARHLISEAPQVRSAATALLFTPRHADAPFDVGRRFYRLWLEVTALGFHLVPMSASADHQSTRDLLAAEHGLSPDRRIANVLRVGRVRPGSAARSARLPVDELLV